MNFINKKFKNLHNIALDFFDKYTSAEPFSHIVIDDFFEENLLQDVLDEFPSDLDKKGLSSDSDPQKLKFNLIDYSKFGKKTKLLLDFTNSYIFLNFINKITGIKEPLISDPYFQGGGLHELKNTGYLNVHSDFNKHQITGLDRRVNVLIYLNHNWKSEYGGSLELWDSKMSKCVRKISPIFNRIVIFDTTDFSFHGNPEPIRHPNNVSRKSIALYYYSNGRPKKEIIGYRDTPNFKNRPNTNDKSEKITIYKKLFWKLFYKTKVNLQ